jgi:hypothetical protein
MGLAEQMAEFSRIGSGFWPNNQRIFPTEHTEHTERERRDFRAFRVFRGHRILPLP